MLESIFKKGGWPRTTVYILAGIFVALIIFQAGMVTGEHRASFSYRMGDAYARAFEKPESRRETFIGAHGAAGKIVSIHLPTFVIEAPDNTERVITIGPDTEVRRFRDVATSTDLNVDDFVVVIGEPDDAEIAAKLIRILPPPAQEL